MVLQRERIETTWRRQAWWRIKRYGPLLVWMAIIYFASTGELSASNTSRIVGPLLRWLFPNISEEQIALGHFIVRKAAHFIEYAILGCLAALAFTTSSREAIRRRWLLLSLAVVVIYALLDEFHQSFVDTRTGSIYDSFIDMSGGLAGLLIYTLIRRSKARRRAKA